MSSNKVVFKTLRIDDFNINYSKIALKRAYTYAWGIVPIISLIILYCAYTVCYYVSLLLLPLIISRTIFHILYRGTFKDWNVNSYVSGSIIFSDEYIFIEECKIEKHEIKNVKIKNGYYRGFSKTNKLLDFGLPIYNGISEISILLESNKVIKVKYLIEDDIDFIRYKNIILRLYKSNICIYESDSYSDEHTFLFEKYSKKKILRKLGENCPR